MEEARPNPDILLKRIKKEAASDGTRGRLKIFFGYAAGVGKTYAMLEAANAAAKSGADIAVGYVEPHSRPETMALLEGQEVLPPLVLRYRGITLREFDLDSALSRSPKIILVDELAHTNAEGCRHRKRYMDVNELLRSGIDVWTTVNVQHLESLNDLVSSITGTVVAERLPDSVFDSAAQVEVIDIEPEDLIARLRQGKIYKERQAHKALENFFSRGNLDALREIALRRTADRLNMSAEKSQDGLALSAGEQILTCISASPSNPKVLRNAARIAAAFKRSLIALFVDGGCSDTMDEKSRARLNANMKLAKDLGARVVTIYGSEVPLLIAEYAKISGISKIVIGRSNHKSRLFSQTLVEKLSAIVPNLDIYIIPDNLPKYRPKLRFKINASVFSFSDLAKSACAVIGASCVGLFFDYAGFDDANIMMVYILGVLLTAIYTSGWLYGALVSFVSVFAFNFLFTEPRLTFMVYDSSYPVTFIIMLSVSVITGTLAMKLRQQAVQSTEKAYRTEILLEAIQKIHKADGSDEIIKAAAQQIIKLTERSVIFYPSDKNGGLAEPLTFTADGKTLDPSFTSADEKAVAIWSYRNNKQAGATTDTLPSAKCLYYAVRGENAPLAEAALAMEGKGELGAFERNLLLAILSECGMTLERLVIRSERQNAVIKAQREALRSNLLRAVSHDLRTPLTSITGNSSLLMEDSSVLDNEKRMQIYKEINNDSVWLTGLVENLLSVTRIENGTMEIKTEPELIDDIFGEAARIVSPRSGGRTIKIETSGEIIMAIMDARLILQVIINLLDNAVKYTPPKSAITLSALASKDKVTVNISDDGEGISAEAKEHIFEMFYTAGISSSDGRRGLGIGLSLCRSIIEAHGGEISVSDNNPKGTTFSFTLKRAEADTGE